MDIFEIIILGLAVFRMTHLIVFDKITESLRSPFFDEVTEMGENGVEEIFLVPKQGGLKGFMGELLSCYWCTGIWVALFLYAGNIFLPLIFVPIITVLAVAGIASIVEAAVQSWIRE
ncbi:DUF1360 domain-containing protein [Rossellomorea sp. AcN35-11]|nr:DUF1360 domain-containing protein [Rossellomorea aquimaris]NMH69433.1 DUF1360 domain-containing protein [Bacillus sp. RO3]WJV29173.1 DUF1360 domain-containing protein [Rossellomorea sp. AcN35-11]